jgi:hypothetical protein
VWLECYSPCCERMLPQYSVLLTNSSKYETGSAVGLTHALGCVVPRVMPCHLNATLPPTMRVRREDTNYMVPSRHANPLPSITFTVAAFQQETNISRRVASSVGGKPSNMNQVSRLYVVIAPAARIQVSSCRRCLAEEVSVWSVLYSLCIRMLL